MTEQLRENLPSLYQGKEGMSDVPEGYRMSEVGVIPKEWQMKTLGELSKIVRGGSPRPAGDPKYFNGNYIPWLTVAALTKIPKSLIYVSQTMDFLTEAGSKKSRTLESGTLILSNSGATLGVCKILSIKCCANDGIAALLDFNKNIDKLYVCYFLNTKTKQFREVVATGNGQPNLNTTLIGLTQIPLPPLPEQQAIASALSDVDALITALEQLITKKRNIKQGAMQQLLTGKKRLPGFDGEWKVKTLENVCAKNGLVRGPFGGTLKKEFFVRNGLKVYEQKNAIYRNVILGNYFIDKNKFNELKRFEVKIGDFIVSCSGTIGKIYQIPKGAECGIINQALLKIKTDDNIIHDRFFFYYFDWEKFQEKIIDNTQGGAMQNLVGMNIFRNTQILLPPLPEQQAIAKILSDMDTEIKTLEQKRDKYKVIKHGMMQELLSGKTRLAKENKT